MLKFSTRCCPLDQNWSCAASLSWLNGSKRVTNSLLELTRRPRESRVYAGEDSISWYSAQLADLSFLGLTTSYIVPPDSSSLDHPGQRARIADANHMTMCKFSGRSDETYQMVVDDFEELVSSARRKLEQLEG